MLLYAERPPVRAAGLELNNNNLRKQEQKHVVSITAFLIVVSHALEQMPCSHGDRTRRKEAVTDTWQAYFSGFSFS